MRIRQHQPGKSLPMNWIVRWSLLTCLALLLTGCNPPATAPNPGESEQRSGPSADVKPIPKDALPKPTDETLSEMYDRALKLTQQGKSAEAIEVLTEVLAREPRVWNAYYTRGREHFRLGQFEQSLADFDKTIAMQPDVRQRLWERGVTLFYLKRFQEGADQFKLYQDHYDKDVENSVWQFVCRAKVDGVQQARKNMLVIEGDRRVPLMEIYGLFRGTLQPDDVIQASKTPQPDARAVELQKFYANLYLGLYFEATGDLELAKKHTQLAVDYQVNGRSPTNNYMWDVARIHSQWLASER